MKHQSPSPQERPSPVERARLYMQKVAPAISGQNGHDTTFKAACRLVLGFNLDGHTALALLREWNAGCQPAWSEKELERKIREAEKARARPGAVIGDLLGDMRDYARLSAGIPASSGAKPGRSPSPPSGPAAPARSPSPSSGAQPPAISSRLPSRASTFSPSTPAPAGDAHPSAPRASASPLLPATEVAAIRASVAWWKAEGDGEEPDAVLVPRGRFAWPKALDGLLLVEDEVKSYSPVKLGTKKDARDGTE